MEREQVSTVIAMGEAAGLVDAIRAMAADRESCTAMGYRARMLYDEQYAMELGCEKYLDTMDAVK